MFWCVQICKKYRRNWKLFWCVFANLPWTSSNYWTSQTGQRSPDTHARMISYHHPNFEQELSVSKINVSSEVPRWYCYHGLIKTYLPTIFSLFKISKVWYKTWGVLFLVLHSKKNQIWCIKRVSWYNAGYMNAFYTTMTFLKMPAWENNCEISVILDKICSRLENHAKTSLFNIMITICSVKGFEINSLVKNTILLLVSP